jgi:hypothetical protein
MPAEIITKEDLNQFGKKLLSEIQKMLGKPEDAGQRLLKSYQVKNLLKISPGTLQKLRDNGTLRFTRMGSIFYYKYDDVMEIFNQRENGN